MVAVGSNWSSNGVADGDWGSNGVADGDWGLGHGVDGGGVSGDDGLGGVGLNSGVVDVRGLHDLLDGVDLVGGGDGDGPGHGDLVRLGHVGVGDDLTGDSSGHGHGHVHVVLVDLDLGHDVGHLGGHLHVAPHGGGDLLDGDGVSGGGAGWDGCGGDGSVGSRGHGDSGGSDRAGLNNVLGSSHCVGGGWLGDGLLAGHHVLVSSHHTGHPGLDCPGSDHSVLHPVLHHGGPGGVAVVGLADHGGGGGHWGGHQRVVGQVGGGSQGDSQVGE